MYHLTPLHLRTLAQVDPDIAQAIADETDAPEPRPRTDRLRELRERGRDGRRGLGDDQQVRGGLPGQALLRRLRVRRRRRVAGHPAGTRPVRRRARQRAAPLGRAGQHGRDAVVPAAGRHHPRHEPGPRRAPDARPPAELLGQALQGRAVRRARGRRAPRLRRARAPRARAQAEADRRRRERLPARHRFRTHRDRGQGRRRAHAHRHGAHRRPRGRRRAPEPGAPQRLRHDHHAQDAARSARRIDPLPAGVREGDRSRRVPRRAGRPADAHHRRQGGVLPRGARAAVPRLPGAGGRPTPGASRRRCATRASASSAAAPTTT